MVLFVVLSRKVERRVGEFKLQELANTAWVFAMAGQSDPALFVGFERVAEQRVAEFKQ